MFKVLVVDDDENVSIFMSRLLQKRFNCRVVLAKDGLDGLLKLKEEEPEVVFLDITMPVLNGVESLRAIRGDEKFKDIPVIMLTAVGDTNIVSKVMSLRVYDYILKPVTYNSAYEKIKEIFDHIKEDLKEKELLEKEKEAFIAKKIKMAQDTKDKLLIVDTDKEFRDKLRKQMESSYEIIESEDGASALKIYMSQAPKIICLGENLPLINEKLLARKIKSMSVDEEVVIFAIKEHAVPRSDESGIYDCVVPRNGGSDILFGSLNKV